MNYTLLKEVIGLLEKFESAIEENKAYTADRNGFMQWINDCYNKLQVKPEPDWEGKENGRSAESAINTLIVHLNRYARTYAKAAIWNSAFSTQEEFIYLINLRSFGAMSKMDLIKKNVHDKPVGMQIIQRLIRQGWVIQQDSLSDRRSKIIHITEEGLLALDEQMNKIRQATTIVTGALDNTEKMELIRMLNKLEQFHKPIFSANIDTEHLLETVYSTYLSHTN